jgi:gamma-glutamylcyclotransferase (GGCT)/AIG2-like uncharacterized protein YtfP
VISCYLFVYGSLRRGASPMSNFLDSVATRIGLGRAQGKLYRLDGYPGMIASTGDSDWVIGEVLQINDPATWTVLDEYEGCGPSHPEPHEFQRRIVTVEMDDGRQFNAWAYVYCGDVSGRVEIRSGDYLSQ